FWQSLAAGKDMPHTRAFLYKIAGNLIIDWYRKKKSGSLDKLQEAGFEPEDGTLLPADREAEIREVRAAVESLEEKDREVVLLRYVEGLEPREIAEICGET